VEWSRWVQDTPELANIANEFVRLAQIGQGLHDVEGPELAGKKKNWNEYISLRNLQVILGAASNNIQAPFTLKYSI
jgi:hypothetical protein